MKQIIYALMFVLIGGLPVIAQSEKSVCPKIEVKGGEEVRANKQMYFSAELSDEAKNLKVEYEWSVSAGKISNGQGTDSIIVDTTGLNAVNITATVKIKGLPANCLDTGSEIGGIMAIPEGQPVNDYGKLSSNDEKAQIDAFLSYLLANPDDEGLIVVYGDTVELAKNRVRKIIKHIKFRKFPLFLITFSIPEPSEERTTLWQVPPGADFPECEGCITIKAEEF